MEFETSNEKQTIANPLVSIIVITYNSSKYIIETLESIKAQTYQNIELIVSDDFSIDNTVEICRKWIGENKSRFVRTELITVPINTGIPANFNRGLEASEGEWVKFIAGDDALLDNCILDNLNRIKKIPEKIYAIHSDVKYYSLFLDEKNFLFKTDKSLDTFCNNSIKAIDQLKLLVRGYGPLAPTAFFNRKVLVTIDGFNETLPYEDGPIWVKLTLNNFKIHYLNKTTVKYRLHDSISNIENSKLLFNPIYMMDKVVFEKVYRQHLKFYEILTRKISFLIKDLFTANKMNKNTKLNFVLFRLLNSPYTLLQNIFLQATDSKIQKKIKYGK